MKKLLSILFTFFLINPSLADHTNEHTITVSCDVVVGHAKGSEDIGPIDIAFNKKKVSLSWMGDISKIIKLDNMRPGSGYHDVEPIFNNYKNGNKTENFSDFFNKYQPVSFVNYSMRPYKNISTTDTTLVALSEKYDQEYDTTKYLSVIIILNRVNAVGTMTLRKDFDETINYPVMNYFNGKKYFEVQRYLLENCNLKEKKF